MGFFDTLNKTEQVCDTKSPSGPCPDSAYYRVDMDERPPKFYCVRCMSAILFHGTAYGRTVHISRVLVPKEE